MPDFFLPVRETCPAYFGLLWTHLLLLHWTVLSAVSLGLQGVLEAAYTGLC